MIVNPTTNYAIADFVSSLNLGIIRNTRSIRIHKTVMSIRLLYILYKQGVIRNFSVRSDYIEVFFKFYRSRHVILKLKVISNLVKDFINH